MQTSVIALFQAMMDALPEASQKQLAGQLREYLVLMRDEARWDALFEQTQDALERSARRVREEINAGNSRPMDYDDL